MKRALIVHGGAGSSSPADEERLRLEGCERAADAGWDILTHGGSALDAVEAAVRALEDDPIFNAGTGSYLQADGVARLDASIMAADGRAGAVAQVPGLKNPVRLARYLLEQDAHVMLAGPEALQLGLRLGHPPALAATPSKIAYWRKHLDEAVRALDYAAMAAQWRRDNRRLGTVGCVALDDAGRLAAATSTGGTGQCYPGRVGDTPVIGAGTYAARLAAVSMTGLGERILVLLSAKRLCDLVSDGRPIDRAARAVIDEIGRVSPASAGLIAVDANGGIVSMHDTPFMATAQRTA